MKVLAFVTALCVVQYGICSTIGIADDDLAPDEYALSVNKIVDDAPTLHVSQLTVHAPPNSYAYVVLKGVEPLIGVKVASDEDTSPHATITLAAQNFAVRDVPNRVQGFTWSCRTAAQRSSTTIFNSAEVGEKPNEGDGVIRLTAKAGRYKQGIPIEIFTVNGQAYVLHVTKTPPKQSKLGK